MEVLTNTTPSVRPDLSLLSSTTLLVLSTLLIVAWTTSKNAKQKKTNEQPPPKSTMGFMEFFHVMASPSAPFLMLEHARSLGTYCYRVPLQMPGLHPMVVMVGDANVARQIWKDPKSKRATMLFASMEASMGGPNILTTNGKLWKDRRHGLNPAFAKRHVKRFHTVALERLEEWITENLHPIVQPAVVVDGTTMTSADDDVVQQQQESPPPKSFDVGQGMLHLTLSILSEAAFDYRMSYEERANVLTNVHLQFDEFLTKSFHNPFRNLPGSSYVLPERRRAWKAAMENQDLAAKIVRHHHRNKKQHPSTTTASSGNSNNNKIDQNTNTDNKIILDYLLSNPCYKTEKELYADIFLVLAGGHDSTAFTMAFTLMELARPENADYQRKLRQELQDIQQRHHDKDDNKEEAAGTDDDDDDHPKWSESVLLQNAIKEGMRMYPAFAIGAGSRIVGSDVIVNNMLIPKGSLAMMLILSMQRNRQVFEDPDVFCPDRWENATQEQHQAVVPFVLGAQNCIGQSLAKATVGMVLPRLLVEYEFTLVEEGPIVYAGSIRPTKTMLSVRRCR